MLIGQGRVDANQLVGVTIALIGAWLLASLYFVNIDFDDGYSTVVNSQYLLGLTGEYAWQRGPLLAAWLIPAEFFANLFGLAAFDVRPHHALMGLAHLIYLLACWRLISRIHSANAAAVLGFILAVPTLLFFSYALFVSHDIFPGVIALAMLVLAHAESQAPRFVRWIALVVLGAAAALIKQTFALFWVLILLTHLALALVEQRPIRTWLPALLRLGMAAVVSAAVVWMGYALVLGGTFPDAHFLMRPLEQINYIATQYEGEQAIDLIMDPWIYARNAFAYGLVALLLVLPGLVLCWRRKNLLLRQIAVFWVLALIAMVLVPFKEVRYLAFLAPLTAVLIVPALDQLLTRRWVMAPLLLLYLALDLAPISREAIRIGNSFYADTVIDFVRWLPAADDATARVITTKPLSFVSPESWGFRNDRYHRITHISDFHIRNLYGYDANSIRNVPLPANLNEIKFRDNDWVVFVNDVAVREPPFRADNATSLHDYFTQFVARVETVELHRDGANFVVTPRSDEPLMLLPKASVSAEPLTSFEIFPAAGVAGLLGMADAPSELEWPGLRIKRFCRMQSCQEFAR